MPHHQKKNEELQSSAVTTRVGQKADMVFLACFIDSLVWDSLSARNSVCVAFFSTPPAHPTFFFLQIRGREGLSLPSEGLDARMLPSEQGSSEPLSSEEERDLRQVAHGKKVRWRRGMRKVVVRLELVLLVWLSVAILA